MDKYTNLTTHNIGCVLPHTIQQAMYSNSNKKNDPIGMRRALAGEWKIGILSEA